MPSKSTLSWTIGGQKPDSLDRVNKTALLEQSLQWATVTLKWYCFKNESDEILKPHCPAVTLKYCLCVIKDCIYHNI